MENKKYDQTNVTAHEGNGIVGNSLEELWLEIGGSCHLKCEYCFAKSGGIDTCKDNVSIGKILSYLNEFKQMGGKRIGIVGAGEPFHAKNIEDTFALLDYAKSANIKTSIFTTGDLISDALIDRIDNYPKIALYVKYNSKKKEVQDNLVHLEGYTQRRNIALDKLISRGYNDGKRLGIVTSIMKANLTEMGDILRFARDKTLIFDADTLIPRGRGAGCGLNLSDEQTKNVLLELKKIDGEEYKKFWEIIGTYIASPPCTRFSNHMYIDKVGKVHPCVSSQGIVLGDVKTQSLNEIWASPRMKIIRDHKYSGKCTTCENFKEKKCYSCLGRACDPETVTNEFLDKNGFVQTKGCFAHKSLKGGK